MNLTNIARRLGSVKIDNIEEISKEVRASSEADYAAALADEVVRQRLEKGGFYYDSFTSELPYVISPEGVVVAISPLLVTPDSRKSSVHAYGRRINSQLNGNCGLIHFLPFQLNGNKVRTALERELKVPVAFLNLAYDAKSIERRFRQYGGS